MAVVVAAVLGLVIGSFLNVVVARVPLGQSVVRPASHCFSCGTVLVWRDNVPIASWIVLRGRCRTCRTPISARYPVVEAGCAALFALVALRVGAHWDLPAMLVAAAGLLALSAIDLDTKRLPDRVVFPTLLGTAALLVLAAAVDDRWDDLGRAGVGAVIGFGALFVIHVVRPDGMGFGDVKLAALCGLVLGWYGLTEVVVGLYAGFVLGAVIAVVLMAFGRTGFGKTIPFGPFLAAGTVLVVLAGAPLADAIRDFW
ncbi:MAG TPA: prepilin peptidase [Acidimicrobiales bacterium]|jgi:leader peptidase (prepilin peptidase)/N-methyltransferase|nr:prepilin peptidase [Acidimicrobiales bacterium]